MPGTRVALFGKIELDTYRGELQIMHPEMEFLTGEDDDGDSALHVGRIVPVYEAAGKVNTRVLRVSDPPHSRRSAGTGRPSAGTDPPQTALPFSRPKQSAQTHFPPPGSPITDSERFPFAAQFRLIFEEFFWLECGLAIKRGKARAMPGIAFEIDDRVREQIKSHAAVQAHRRAETSA